MGHVTGGRRQHTLWAVVLRPTHVGLLSQQAGQHASRRDSDVQTPFCKKIFNLIAKFMDAFYIKWRVKLISMSSDGKNTMTNRHAGIITRIVACVENEVLHIWCVQHHMDIVVKAVSKGIDNGI